MKKAFYRITSAALLAAAPLTAFAAVSDLNAFLQQVVDLINNVIVFLIAVATLVFIWGIVQYIASGQDAGKQAEARKYIIFAIIALVAIVGIWGFVNIVLETLNLNTQVPSAPSF